MGIYMLRNKLGGKEDEKKQSWRANKKHNADVNYDTNKRME